MANRLCWGLLLLLMISLPWPQSVGSPGENFENDSRVLVALSYPSVRIGPYSWRYFRVEVPPAFAELAISLTRKWIGEHIGNVEGNVPLVCFRFGSPPLPDSILESPQAAAMAAGRAENPVGKGTCAWFHSNSSMALTNTQIVAGVWYVGVFSDSQPSRFQSKMISRGSIFTFGIHFSVLGCKSPNCRGHDCSVAVEPLPYKTLGVGLTSRQSSGKAILTTDHRNKMPHLNQPIISVGEEAWTSSLKSQYAGPNKWKHFSLEVADFSLRLRVWVNGTGEAKFYLKYGALPNDGNNGTAINSSPILVSVPRRGPWYVGVHNFNMTQALDFDLYWHVESNSNDTMAMNSMERVLVEDAQESPFDLFYGLAGKEHLQYNFPWFSLSEMTHIGNATSGNWTYFFVEVPRGAAGAVLSVQLRRVVHAAVSVYARLEGLATPDHWDVKIMNVEDQEKRRSSQGSGSFSVNLVEVERQKYNQKLSLDLIYPPEGIWCIAVHYTKHVESVEKGRNLEDTPQQFGMSTRVIQLWRNTAKSLVHRYQSFVEWLRISWREFRDTVYFYNSRALEKASALPGNMTNKEADIGFFLEDSLGPSFAKQPLIEVSSERKDLDAAQMHISVHGCLNKCSGKGHCVTSYESSRLHFISYCHCDAAHGGIDCGVPLLVPTEESLHVWALIGSNFAALLPSFWAIRHHAYSEWVSYVASGVSSGFYHSCDAGGWCALSYDTLQFLDFWLSFVVVIMTCLSVASLKHDTKAVAHVAAAILTAAITKENATSAWNVLLVVLMGLACLLLGWALECWRLRLLPSWFSAIGPNIRPVLQMESIYHRGEQLLGVIKARFQWFYLSAGLAILFAAGLSWVVETADTYWIWHSIWHLSIYTSAFLILCSTSKSSWTPSEVNAQGYERANLHAPSDPEASPMLRHTVELDAFVNESDRSLDD